MSWSLTQQSEDMHDQLTILLGSAIRLLRGEAGAFVVSNEAFDPQSSEEYTLYRLSNAALSTLLAGSKQGTQPTSARPFVTETLATSLVEQLALFASATGEMSGNRQCDHDASRPGVEHCALFLHDQAGVLGTLHYLRLVGAPSALEQSAGALPLLRAQLAAGLRFALKSQALLKEQERLAAIFQHSAEGILTVDSALRIIDFNPAMERLTGWRESEVLGRFYYEVLRPKDRQGHDLGLQNSPILQAFAEHPVSEREMQVTARDGQLFIVSVTASCVYSARGEPMNGILNVRDITREREQEEQRSTFISVISHELQTPIAIIKGYASTLARTDAEFDRPTLHTRLIAMEEEADRLNKLVGNLLYASRIEAGGLQMEILPLDLGRLIEGIVRRFGARSPQVSVTLDIPETLPLVMADRDRVEEVLQNLLDNAVKYSPRQRAVTIACRAIGEEVIVGVSDQGMGISLRDQAQIFERFHRSNDRSVTSKPGAGLGLYICRAIVEAHGGRIWVESVLHEGSTFLFSLPRKEKAFLPMVVF